MASRILNCSILEMGNQLGTLIDAHSSPGIHGLFLGLIMPTAALCVFTLHIPTAVGIGDDMMFFSWHTVTPQSKMVQQGHFQLLFWGRSG